ncbi:MAG: uncharacterized protein KVP18_002529 [Porospora cf. gigantea A]|uniref:uncharacterized protein n=1 Tax=Porospora cf. gigantea A TaxID=2853593 RepID=UPI0035594462|nr:MAG: hypothetical protein KVP18_002529 [Porospora cf. gigantea A]
MAAPASSTSQLKASSHLTVPSLVLRALGTVYCTGVFVLLNVWVVPSIVNCLTSGGGPSKLTAFIQSHDLYLKSRLLDVSRILEGVPHPFAGLFVGLVCRVLFDNVLRSRSSFSSEPSLVRLWDQRSSMLRFLANPMKPINHFYVGHRRGS